MYQLQVKYWPTLLAQWFETDSIMKMVSIRLVRSLQDQKNGWRVTHAAAALRGRNAAKIFLQVFDCLEKTSYLTLFSAKDRDGDTPLHSVVKTGDLKRLNILLDRLPPKMLNSTLEMTNNHGQCPLKVAFDQQEWEMLERLLEYCIQNTLCCNLTGIGRHNLRASKTLLHRAMNMGCSRFVMIYFDIIARNLNDGRLGIDLLVCDKKGRTPWYHLMNHKDPKILQSVLRVLKQHNIDINELVTDKSSRSTMLHIAYRKKRPECIKLLLDAGADPGREDARGLRADQRDHWIEGSREGCEEQAAHEQQHIPPVPAESGVQSDESQQQMSSDEEAVEEEMSLKFNVLNPKHQLVGAGSYSPQVSTDLIQIYIHNKL